MKRKRDGVLLIRKLLVTVILRGLVLITAAAPSFSLIWNESYDRSLHPDNGKNAGIKNDAGFEEASAVSDGSKSNDSFPTSRYESQHKTVLGSSDVEAVCKTSQTLEQKSETGNATTKTPSDAIMITGNQTLPVRLDAVVPPSDYVPFETP